ncbi:MAG: FliM/FliN family flagellar motor C-terminal domain-containing protein [Acidobacteriia bacterium]|nr:FliM/FliN family flagellar motor C-terminal domain-containing protein [Terriglobia bacterium]
MAENSASLTSIAPPSAVPPALWEEAGWLDCQMSVELPLHKFTVRDLLQLAAGSIVETNWKNGEDMPLRANRRQIAWVEFEALGDALGVRVTELI